MINYELMALHLVHRQTRTPSEQPLPKQLPTVVKGPNVPQAIEFVDKVTHKLPQEAAIPARVMRTHAAPAFWSGPVFMYDLMTRHGLPAHTDQAGISLVTTLPAPITQPSPI